LIQVVAGSVMEGASMMFHGDYKKRCLLTILVSQILLLTLLITEIMKSTTVKGFFSTKFKNSRPILTKLLAINILDEVRFR
jgi:hypothetical protein